MDEGPVRIRIGRHLRAMRERRGWTQAHCAVQVGVTRQMWGLYEDETHNPGLGRVRVLMRLFGCSFLDLFNGERAKR